MSELKTYKDCLEVVDVVQGDRCIHCGAEEAIHQYETLLCPKDGIEETRYDRIKDEYYQQKWEQTTFELPSISTSKNRIKLDAIDKMMVIAEAVGMEEGMIWMLLEYTSDGVDVSDGDWTEQTMEFIHICQDPDGDGDPAKNLFEPFKPESK